MRLVTSLGTAMALSWFAWAIVAVLVIVQGGAMPLLPAWVGVVGLIVGGSDKGIRPSEDIPIFGEILGRMLASKCCPACGQSIFDHTPPSGYAPELAQHRFWPSRLCTSCGHDMACRVAT